MTTPRPARTLSLREEQRGVTRRRILDAAFDLFAEKGFESVTVNDIITAAGIGRATFYLHFQSKIDLAEALARDIFESGANFVYLLGDLSDWGHETIFKTALTRARTVWPRLAESIQVFHSVPTRFNSDRLVAMESAILDAVRSSPAWRGMDESEAVQRLTLATNVMSTYFNQWASQGPLVSLEHDLWLVAGACSAVLTAQPYGVA